MGLRVRTMTKGVCAGLLTVAMCTTVAVTAPSAWANDSVAPDAAAPQTMESTETADVQPQWQGEGEMPDELKGITNPEHMWQEGAAQEQWEAEQQAKGEQQGAGRAKASAGCSALYDWDTANGYKRFSSAGTGQNCAGKKVFNPAMKVLDVSEHQKVIDWNRVKRSGVDAVILRIGYGHGFEDGHFRRNLQEVRRLGIPFGIYHYSYAYDVNFAVQEGQWVVQLLRKYGVNPSDMALPVFYDVEQGDWGGHRMPTNANAFRPIINAFVNQLASAGYGRTYLYTYLNYANSRLNANDLRARIGWMAQYSYQLSYDFHSGYSDVRGWQYTSIDRISGVSGNVDMSAFDQRIFSDVNWKTPHLQDIAWAKSSKVTDGFPNGTFRGMNTVVRQDMAAFLRRVAVRHNIAGAKTWKPSAADWNRFTDVDPGTPHAADILWLAHAGIADGYDNGNGTQRYEGMAPMYRQDMAAFLYRLAKKANKLGNVRPMSFTDVNASTPHYQEVQWLGGSGISQGYSNGNGTWRYEGMGHMYRQDMVALLHRLDARL